MIEFGWPWCFAMLPLPLLTYFLLPRARHTEAALHVPFFNELASFVAIRGYDQRATITRLLLIAMWLFLVLASARPMWIGGSSYLQAAAILCWLSTSQGLWVRTI